MTKVANGEAIKRTRAFVRFHRKCCTPRSIFRSSQIVFLLLEHTGWMYVTWFAIDAMQLSRYGAHDNSPNRVQFSCDSNLTSQAFPDEQCNRISSCKQF